MGKTLLYPVSLFLFIALIISILIAIIDKKIFKKSFFQLYLINMISIIIGIAGAVAGVVCAISLGRLEGFRLWFGGIPIRPILVFLFLLFLFLVIRNIVSKKRAFWISIFTSILGGYLLLRLLLKGEGVHISFETLESILIILCVLPSLFIKKLLLVYFFKGEVLSKRRALRISSSLLLFALILFVGLVAYFIGQIYPN